MGDGIMAVFGAPLEQSDHADRAMASAEEMLERRLPEVNDWMRERGVKDGFQIGIGLGPVMAGNIGSRNGWSTRRSATPSTPRRGSRE